MVVKKKSNAPKEVGLKDVKKDMLKLIDSIDALEQKIVNVSHRVKKLEARVGIPIWKPIDLYQDILLLKGLRLMA